jgi:hypothetical protein
MKIADRAQLSLINAQPHQVKRSTTERKMAEEEEVADVAEEEVSAGIRIL